MILGNTLIVEESINFCSAFATGYKREDEDTYVVMGEMVNKGYVDIYCIESQSVDYLKQIERARREAKT